MRHLLYSIAVSAAALALCQGCKPKSSAPAEPQWQLVWEENFDGESFDTAVWCKIPRGQVDWNNTMSDADSLFAVRDGKMVLRGVVNSDLKADPSPYLTSGVMTLGKKAFGHGRIEVNAKLQAAKGAWPAIWLMPFERKADWPMCGEIDIMERLNHDSIAYQTVHSNYTYNLGHTENPKSSATGMIDPDGFNVYAVEMYPDSIVFFINDVKTNMYPRLADMPADSLQFPFNQDWYLMLDMQLGGNWVGEVDPAELPVEMEVDWVRYYQKQ